MIEVRSAPARVIPTLLPPLRSTVCGCKPLYAVSHERTRTGAEGPVRRSRATVGPI